MKKNISINIGGIIFHIEEDGYDRLKNYLDSINRYFSSFEDSKEIIDDIENRIAEILLGKLSDGKQVIVIEDIDELVTTMGTVADFEAAIDTDTDGPATGHTQQENRTESTTEAGGAAPKRLFRDSKHRLLGGVASGLAHYFNIDALWVRLLFLALLFNLLLAPVSGATLLAYIILWIVLPPNDGLEEDKDIKKLFRSSEGRVMGGVASGIAAYFGTDTAVIRLLFVLSIFLGGAGIILYIIMWIITPEARTITEKMQMQGEPVTLSNIESNVKKSLNVQEGEENLLVKILLFPFRLIAIVINGLAEILGPFMKFLVEALRIVFGVVVMIIGVALVFSFIILLAVLLGIGGIWGHYTYIDDLPIQLLADTFNGMAAGSVFLILFIPAVAISLLGISIIARRSIGNSYLGWAMLGLWILGLIGALFVFPTFAHDFRVENDFREERTFAKPASVPTLRLSQALEYENYDGVDLRLRGHADTAYLLVLRTEARGSDRQDAETNARAVTYSVQQKGSDFYFDEELSFSGAPFRFQRLEATLYIPQGDTFRMEAQLAEILTNTLHLYGYRSYQMEENDWVFGPDGLRCITCEPVSSNQPDRRPRTSRSRDRDYWDQAAGEAISYEFQDFSQLEISSYFKVQVEQSDHYRVEVKGTHADDVRLAQYGDRLEIKQRDSWDWWHSQRHRDHELYLLISAPDLQKIQFNGACKGKITGFDTPDMEISLNGASDLEADLTPDELVIDMNGASRLRLTGGAHTLKATLNGASRLDAFDFEAQIATVKARGASKINAWATEEFNADAAGVSSIHYKGEGRLNADTDGLSTIKKN